jgi:hypothetical protein
MHIACMLPRCKISGLIRPLVLTRCRSVAYLSIVNSILMTMLNKSAMREQGNKSVNTATHDLTHLLFAWSIAKARVVGCLM